MLIKEYAHRELNEEIRSISGQYTLTDEVRLPFGDRELLYILGHAVMDSSCCGAWGCGYAMVPGFIKQWKAKKDAFGRFVSLMEAITNPELKEKIRALVINRERVQEVWFEMGEENDNGAIKRCEDN